MSTSSVGALVGGILGLLDGLSAWFYPEARAMLVPIVVGSTIKGVLTGIATGLVARWRRSLLLGIGAGIAVGFVLSALAALGQPDHYWAIVLPGMLVGALTGVATQRARSSMTAAVILVALTIPLSAAGLQPPDDKWTAAPR
jgi:hypothetical protein